MTCDCNKDRIELLVKQGTSQSYNFTVRGKDGTPLDLTDYVIQVDIKKYPLAKVQSLISNTITVDSTDAGQITNVNGGQFTIRITEDMSTSLNPDTYYIQVMLVNQDNRIIISGEGDKSGVLRICRQ